MRHPLRKKFARALENTKGNSAAVRKTVRQYCKRFGVSAAVTRELTQTVVGMLELRIEDLCYEAHLNTFRAIQAIQAREQEGENDG